MRFENHISAVISTLFLLCFSFSESTQPLPLVLWHGVGDTCCEHGSLEPIMKLIKEEIPGIYIHSLRIGRDFKEDELNGYLMPISEQIKMACDAVQNDPNLGVGFNVIGFSQGGQFARALIQQCDSIHVHNLISIGGQHQGVYGVPHCMGDEVEICDYIRRLLSMVAYAPAIQNHLVQAQFWHDPRHEDKYHEECIFLPDINNGNVVNKTYVERLTALNKFVMVKFNNDTTVQPVESEWFGFYAPGNTDTVLTLQETDLYKNDQLGLKNMNMQGKLVFIATNGDHIKFSNQWFIDNIIPYLN